MSEKYFFAALGEVPRLGNKSIAALIDFFGSAKTAWFADEADILKSGVRKNSLESFMQWRKINPNNPEKIMDYCEQHKINLCSIADADYPPILKDIDSPPMFFYYRGKIKPLAERIAVVGSRQNSLYGEIVAPELSEELAAAGLTVVSGAARGIDTLAHRGALKTGRTVAVLGCGINCDFSPESQKLLEQIADSGVVLSEFSPELSPNSSTFPQRNRIIAGLCRGLIVVEAREKSGTLIASSYAEKYGRYVFAVPCSIKSKTNSECNNLIRNGALLIRNAQDVLDKYPLDVKNSPQ